MLTSWVMCFQDFHLKLLQYIESQPYIKKTLQIIFSKAFKKLMVKRMHFLKKLMNFPFKII